jgi:hypothetical protein
VSQTEPDDAPLDPRIQEAIDRAIDRSVEDLKAALDARDDQALPFLKFHLLMERLLERLIRIRRSSPNRV